MATQSKRLLSLDVLRGITVAGMLLVNNPGTWSDIYAPLDHAEWIGLTPTDLVFPFFLFCMGVAMYFSLKKFNFTMSKTFMAKVTRRTVLLFVIGWAVHWFSHVMYGMFSKGLPFSEVWNNLDSIRILGVFQRLALCYFFGSLLAVLIKHKFLPWVVGGILALYAVILGVGHGYDFSTDNIISVIDNAVLGSNHMYHESYAGVSISFDPEGILSTLPCIAHCMIGFLIGKMIVEVKDNKDRVRRLLMVGFTFILVGWLLSYGIPCGKKMWSTTFVLLTTGLAMSVLALLIFVIDMKGNQKWCTFFHAFGVNPLSLYVLGSVFSIIFGAIIVCHSDDYVKGDPEQASALYTQLAAENMPQAQNSLGVCYYSGSGVEQDAQKAVQLFKQAEKDSSAVEARYNLALVTMQGEKALNDEAVKQNLTEAADSGMTNAMFNLGLCYDYGKFGCETDHAKAAKYYADAAQKGMTRAEEAFNECLADTVGVTADHVFSDLLVTGLAGSAAFEGDSLTAAQTKFNEAKIIAAGAGDRKSIKGAILNACKAVTLSDKMASCLYAILFVLFNGIFGIILYKKKIIIKI